MSILGNLPNVFVKSCVAIFMVTAPLSGSAQSMTGQAFPAKLVRVIIPYPAGGGSDPIARMLAPQLSEKWGQPVIVDNRSGADGMVGTNAVAKAPPDGYTILLTPATFVTTPSLAPNLPYDPVKDFAPVATIVKNRFVLLVHPSVSAQTLKELIVLAKARPGQLNFASAGTGSGTHLAGELLNIMAGTDIRHIPYKGTGAAMTDLLGGHVQMIFSSPLSAAPHLNSGKLKVIAISGEPRLPALPQVPTFAEGGLAGFDANGWYGVLVPAATSKEIVSKLSVEINRILATPDIRESLVKQGMEPYISTPDQFAAMIRKELDIYAKVVRTANIKVD